MLFGLRAGSHPLTRHPVSFQGDPANATGCPRSQLRHLAALLRKSVALLQTLADLALGRFAEHTNVSRV